jgi:hypothetical protein
LLKDQHELGCDHSYSHVPVIVGGNVFVTEDGANLFVVTSPYKQGIEAAIFFESFCHGKSLGCCVI